MLTWTVSGATSISINNGVGVVTGSTATVTPTASTTYVLTAQNAAGSATASIPVTVTASSAATADTNAAFSVSYRGSDLDQATGLALGGTEFRNLVSHKGRLFGGLDAFRDAPPAGSPVQTARIVVKDTAAAPWRVDRAFDEPLPPGAPRQPGRPAIRHEGVTAMASVRFETDFQGRALAGPVDLLVAGMRDFAKGLSIYVRNDAQSTWSELLVEQLPTTESTIRSIGRHRDKVTGIDLMFVGGNPGGIYSAAYDPASGLVFRTPAELPYTPASQSVSVRPMAFAVCDGDVFSLIAPYVYRRIDGPSPRWEVILDYSSQFTPTQNGPSGLRGLTCVDTPGGPGQSLIAGLEGGGLVFRLDKVGATWRLAPSPEFNTNSALSAVAGSLVTYTVIANNTFTPLVSPDTGETFHLMTVATRPELSDDAWYALRSPAGVFTLRSIPAGSLSPRLPLRSTRTAVVSPFPEENGSIVYIAGYDVVDDPSRNTAYVLRAGLRTVLGTAGTALNARCPTAPVLATASGVLTQDILPSVTIGTNPWNSPHVVITHSTAPKTGKLLVFMAGSNGAPGGYRGAMAVGARQGHNVIGLNYPNSWTVDELCKNDPDVNCDRKVRGEIFSGEDLSPHVPVDVNNSIQNRLKALLGYLIVQQPGRGWDRFLEGGQLRWDRMILSGHSQGGGHAAFIAKQRAVARVAMFAAPADYNERLSIASPWISDLGLTPNSAYFGFDHRDDPLVRYASTWSALGLPVYGGLTTIDGNAPPYGCSRQLLTTRTPPGSVTGTQIHNAVVVDGATPTTNGIPDFTDVWAHLFGP